MNGQTGTSSRSVRNLAVKKISEEDKTRKRIPIRFIRWKSDLSVYNVTFVHREGAKNIADYLSRRYAKEMKNNITVKSFVFCILCNIAITITRFGTESNSGKRC